MGCCLAERCCKAARGREAVINNNKAAVTGVRKSCAPSTPTIPHPVPSSYIPPSATQTTDTMPRNATMPASSDSADRPGRSRNAKAQARHRAKRKAYIDKVRLNVSFNLGRGPAVSSMILALSDRNLSSISPLFYAAREHRTRTSSHHWPYPRPDHQLPDREGVYRPACEGN